jgi:hypothetical protein
MFRVFSPSAAVAEGQLLFAGLAAGGVKRRIGASLLAPSEPA